MGSDIGWKGCSCKKDRKNAISEPQMPNENENCIARIPESFGFCGRIGIKTGIVF
jgi:hypothetical protein